jgi:hypothetical protein
MSSNEDLEKANTKEIHDRVNSTGSGSYDTTTAINRSFTQRLIYSFGRDSPASAIAPGGVGADVSTSVIAP